MKTTAAATLLLVLGLSSASWAQGFGRDFDRYSSSRIDWYPSLDKAMAGDISEMERRRMRFMNQDPPEKKYVFVYVRPLAEDKEPGEFQNQDVVNASRGSWSFVKLDFDKDNAHIKGWGVKVAPALVTCDLKGNDFMKSGAVSNSEIKRVLGGTPEMIQRYEQKIRADFARALELLKSDDAKAVKVLGEIVATGKHGYKEVTDAQAKLGEIAETSFKRGELAESVSFDAGVEYFDEVARIYKGTPPGARAEIRSARLEHERGNTKKAADRLQAVAKLDPRVFKAEIEEAQKALDEISKAGK